MRRNPSNFDFRSCLDSTLKNSSLKLENSLAIKEAENVTFCLKGEDIILEKGNQGDNRDYKFNDSISNWTFEFIEFPGGKGRLIGSLELPNGQLKEQYNQRCFKIG